MGARTFYMPAITFTEQLARQYACQLHPQNEAKQNTLIRVWRFRGVIPAKYASTAVLVPLDTMLIEGKIQDTANIIESKFGPDAKAYFLNAATKKQVKTSQNANYYNVVLGSIYANTKRKFTL